MAVLTSSSEGMPNSLLEAMACSLPVISTAVGGCVDIVKPGSTGLLVAPDDQRGLEAALTQLSDSDTMRQSYGASGLALIRERHTSGYVIRELETLYESLLDRTKRGA